tara:strand:- start:122 stop:664 length:543 start_codon:yes stop_codon:yes gene_type:complete
LKVVFKMKFMEIVKNKKIVSFASLCFFLFFFRYLPHPPNFTPVIAFGIYLPVIFGIWSIPFFILSFAITDFFVGFHSLMIWTWGSLVIISLFFKLSYDAFSRVSLSLFGACLFFIFTNFGVWLGSSYYEANIQGLFSCYIMAIPFFTNTLISTIIFSLLFEILFKYRIFFQPYKLSESEL